MVRQLLMAFGLGLAGLLVLIDGLRVRSGASRGALRWYANRDMSRSLRNSAFGSIPLGAALFLLGVAVALFTFDARTPGLVGVAVAFVAFALFGVAVVFMLWPPAFLKPTWLRELELRGPDAVEAETRALVKRPFEAPAWQLWLGWVGLGAGVVAYIVFDLPPSVLAGLGMGMLILASAQLRRRGSGT